MARVFRDALTDVHQLCQTFHQLRDAPAEVQELFQTVDSIRRSLLNVASLVAKHHLSTHLNEHMDTFRRFRNRLMELELFIDPDQILPRSGPGSYAQHAIQWYGLNPGDQQFLEFCNECQTSLKELEQSCDDFGYRIQRYVL
jgi:hypothetical protein